MNPRTGNKISLTHFLMGMWRYRALIHQMIKRDVIGRYKGSLMGIGWSFFNPILMLVVYTFIFSVVFKARWEAGTSGGKTEFAIILFVGMIVHGLFAEVLNRAPTLIQNNANYVKKVVFPLEILPIVSMGTAVFHGAISVLVLLSACFIINGFIYGTAIFIPIVLLPLVFMTLGFAWLFASLGVYLRDVGQTIGIITTVMLFLAPVFYPVTSIPEDYKNLLLANPLTFIIEESRKVLIFGMFPDWIGLLKYAVVSLLVCWLGFAWFQKTRKGFADVI